MTPQELQDAKEQYLIHRSYTRRFRNILLRESLKMVIKTKKLFYLSRIAIVLVGILLTNLGYTYIKEDRQSLLAQMGFLARMKTAKPESIIDPVRNHQAFLNRIGFLESGNNYNPRDETPDYFGKYQIGRAALSTIGFNISKEDFLESPELQEIAMKLLLKKNKTYLRETIGKYTSRTIKGVYITESGVLAGAHLTGPEGIKQFLESSGNIDPVDGNKKKTSEYIKELGGYNLNL